MLTTRGNTLYLHLNRGIPGNGLKLKPLNKLPSGAVLLNTGKPVDCVVNLSPGDHAEQKSYLRLRNLPAQRMANTVMVVKLDFDEPLI